MPAFFRREKCGNADPRVWVFIPTASHHKMESPEWKYRRMDMSGVSCIQLWICRQRIGRHEFIPLKHNLRTLSIHRKGKTRFKYPQGGETADIAKKNVHTIGNNGHLQASGWSGHNATLMHKKREMPSHLPRFYLQPWSLSLRKAILKLWIYLLEERAAPHTMAQATQSKKYFEDMKQFNPGGLKTPPRGSCIIIQSQGIYADTDMFSERMETSTGVSISSVIMS